MLTALLLLTQAAPQPSSIDLWRTCVLREVDRYAVLDEPAGSLVSASLLLCREQRDAAKADIRKQEPVRTDAMAESVADRVEGTLREIATRRLLDTRLAARKR
ncbi:hypothetical protein [Sphingomonas sp.]|uniref:hypothetical protein n=1 Tax=Sphingomonas sp. TaxID=28214 RepID=UPI002ED844AF